MTDETQNNRLTAVIQGTRPWQWIKNLVIAAPYIFSGGLHDPSHITPVIMTFAAFCLVAGGIYLFNDIVDLNADAGHPEKCRRPLASGRITRQDAIYAIPLLWTCGLLVTGMINLGTLTATAFYAVISISYTLKLKRIVFLDTAVIALGFVMRAVAGALAIEVEISSWLLICTFSLALFLAFAKRYHEITTPYGNAIGQRLVLTKYTKKTLKTMLVWSAILNLITYGFYTINPRTVQVFSGYGLIWSIPPVILGMGRFLHLVLVKGKGGDAARTLVSDKCLQAIILTWGVIVTVVIYL